MESALRQACRELDTSEAAGHGSRTRYDEDRHAVILGANAYSGTGSNPNARMSMQACLAHELAHLQRAELGFRRPYVPPDVHLDEAEASIHASFNQRVSMRDREDLVEDAVIGSSSGSPFRRRSPMRVEVTDEIGRCEVQTEWCRARACGVVGSVLTAEGARIRVCGACLEEDGRYRRVVHPGDPADAVADARGTAVLATRTHQSQAPSSSSREMP